MAWLDPITRKRFARFRQIRRAWWSLWALLAVFLLSLVADLLANDRPLLVRFQGRWISPLVSFYPAGHFLGTDDRSAPDYHALSESPAFAAGSGNRMIWPPIPFGPHQSVAPDRLEIDRLVKVHVRLAPLVATINLQPDGVVTRSVAAGSFFGVGDAAVDGKKLAEAVSLTAALEQAVSGRFANRESPALESRVPSPRGGDVLVSLSAFAPRSSPPRTVRLTLRTLEDESAAGSLLVVHQDGTVESSWPEWQRWPETTRAQVLAWAAESRESAPGAATAGAEAREVEVGGKRYGLRFDPLRVAFPFGPVRGHPLGLDHSGRDVLVRILYATRIGLSFALLLTLTSTVLGVLLGAVQGYFAGWVDMVGQRLIEIWGSLPFLYVVIFLSSVLGRGFLLLLLVYTAFNWIGVSAYMRAEYLRLRRQPFVESALCLGASTRTVMFRHILPNALTPIITFFPFLLVGAIASINALDYLGYGMPAGTPSFGELLNQAQDHRQAWWLTLYPSVSLFGLMLCGVFIGDGLRAAFDPRSASRME